MFNIFLISSPFCHQQNNEVRREHNKYNEVIAQDTNSDEVISSLHEHVVRCMFKKSIKPAYAIFLRA